MGDTQLKNEKLLDRYQLVIERMAKNSFSIKGWSISLGTAVIGFALKDAQRQLAFIALAPAILLFALDSYYLAIERRYREKFNEAAISEKILSREIPGRLVHWRNWLNAACRPASWAIHLAIVVLAVGVGSGWFALPAPIK